MLNKSVAAATAALALLSAAVAPAQAESVKNVVIVHGAFADGSGWRKVADILVKDGYTVSVVQEPLTSLAAAAVRSATSLFFLLSRAGDSGRLAPEEELGAGRDSRPEH